MPTDSRNRAAKFQVIYCGQALSLTIGSFEKALYLF